MHNPAKLFQTTFWRQAYQSLPAGIRRRHVSHLVAAEQWELALDHAIEAWSGIKTYFAPRRVQPH